MHQLSHQDYKKLLCKRWYSISGLEIAYRLIETNKSLEDSERESLLAIASRRINDMVDFRLSENLA
jgi:hypothetical protein